MDQKKVAQIFKDLGGCMSVKKFKLNRKFSKRDLLGLGVLLGVFLAQFSFANTDDGIDAESVQRDPAAPQDNLSPLSESAEVDYPSFNPDPLSQELSPVVQPEVSQSPQGVIEAGVQMLPLEQDQLPSSNDPNQAQNVATF
jgi:hypothetical protein